MVKKSWNLIGKRYPWPHPSKSGSNRSTFPWWLSQWKKLRYQLTLSKNIDDQKVLESDWTRNTTSHTKPKVVVSDFPFCWLYLHSKNLRYPLTLSWRRPLPYRSQSIDLQSKSMDWFLYDNALCHERVKNMWISDRWIIEKRELNIMLKNQLLVSQGWIMCKGDGTFHHVSDEIKWMWISLHTC